MSGPTFPNTAIQNQDELNVANPQNLADLLRQMGLGDLLRSLPVTLRRQAPVPSALANYGIAGGTNDVIVLPDNAKAAMILRATVRTGSTTDELTFNAFGATPATTTCSVSPCGDITFNHGTDAITDVDVTYLPEKGVVVEGTFTPATGVCTLPSSWTKAGVILLLEAEVLAGSVTGKKKILVPLAGGGAGLPATTAAQLTLNKTTVSFNNATDAPTSCRVRCLVAQGFGTSIDSNAALQATAKF